MMSTSELFKLIEVDGKWYVAWHNLWYKDYVIDFSRSFPCRSEARAAAEAGDTRRETGFMEK